MEKLNLKKIITTPTSAKATAKFQHNTVACHNRTKSAQTTQCLRWSRNAFNFTQKQTRLYAVESQPHCAAFAYFVRLTEIENCT